MAEGRKSISKKIRFEVFKRDKFTCQYCGRSAPDVILEVDHVIPVSKGGGNDIMNLITSCRECNRGKGNKELSDDSVIKKQQQQINDLAEKNEQLRMMLKWRDSLKDLEDREIDAFEKAFCRYCDVDLAKEGRKKVKKWLKNYTCVELLDALDESVSQYYEEDLQSANIVFERVPIIAYYKKHPMTDEQRKICYLRKILINRLAHIDYRQAYALIQKAMCNGANFEEIKRICSTCCNWSGFVNLISKVINNETDC